MIGNKNKNREFKMKDKFMHAKIKLITHIKHKAYLIDETIVQLHILLCNFRFYLNIKFSFINFTFILLYEY